jgi:hypothetical protein
MTRRNVIWAFVIAAVAIASLVIGDSNGQRSMRKPIRIEIAAGARLCDGGMARVEHHENCDLKLLAEFVNGDADGPT